MRKAEREIAGFEEIASVVDRCDTIRLGLVDGGEAYIVPVSFGYDASDGILNVYFHGAVAGRKFDLLEKEPRVCVEGDLCHGYKDNGHGGVTCDYESFIGYGRAERLSGEDAEYGIERLMAHCGIAGYACPPGAMKITAVYKITLSEVTGKRRFPR
jgi:nitroimidazol reductase NimA-like FMN-containing flavoprotein (pyridoxamine 5'-phosphate oxidase superfamily)